MGSHQVVSKHSILSARRKNRDAAGTPGTRSREEEVKQFWKRKAKGGERRSRRDHAPCRRSDELSEKDFEIYLDMRLQWLHKFYVTAKSSTREEEGDPEPEPEELAKPEALTEKGDDSETHEAWNENKGDTVRVEERRSEGSGRSRAVVTLIVGDEKPPLEESIPRETSSDWEGTRNMAEMEGSDEKPPEEPPPETLD